MSIVKNSIATKFAAIAIGLAMVLSVAGATPAQAQSVEDLTEQINSLLATIASLQSQLASMTGGGSTSGGSGAAVCPYTWTANLNTGAQGPDVMALQKFLNNDASTQVAASGVGSPGSETDYFGGLTKSAVTKFQNMYAAQVLTPVGLSAGTGYFGPSTRAHMNSLCTSAPVIVDDTDDDGGEDIVDDTADDTTTTGSGVTVGSASQPANSIAPIGASRVPFTSFTLTAGSDGPVTINNVTVERTGFADNNVFAGVVLLGPSGQQIGDAKTLNSNNQAKVGKAWTIPAGQTQTLTVAGNRSTSNLSKDGQVASLSVVGINTSATVNGALPVTGASHVINESLGIGTAEVAVGPSDINSNQSEEVGELNKLFASVRITNTSSDEDIRVRSIRWKQSGSASADDLDNVKVVVDGVEYTTTSDGDFYTANLGSGVVIAEGFNKEFNLRGDIGDAAGQTVQFNIEKATDVYITGETFGFGVTPVQTENGTIGAAGSQMTAGTPFFDGSSFSVNAGTITSFSKSSSVPAQNVSRNVPNQPLGAFEVDTKGEAISVQNMTFYFGFPVKTGTHTGASVTNVTLVDENGAVVAGPVDGAVSGSGGVLTFSDTVTLQTGKHTYSLRGKLASTFANEDTIQASTTPSTDWSGIEGETTGDTITLTSLSSAVAGNVMTVKSANVVAKISTTPSSQNVVAGVSQMLISNLQLDGTQSGEDVRFTSLQLRYSNGGALGDATNCRIFDGTTQLNDSAVNPTAAATAYTFTLNQNVVVAKGTIKTLGVKCDIPGSVASNSTFSFGVNTADTIQGTGLDSGGTVNAMTGATTNVGPTMTVSGSGTLAVTLDPSSPSYALAAAGTADVTLGVLKLTATNEDIRLDRIALQMSNSSASSSPSNLTSVNIYNGATMVGTAVFSGSSRNATTTLTTTLIVPKDDDIQLTVKGTLSEIGASKPGTQGSLVQVDYDGDDSTGTRGVGQDSGSTINTSSSADTASAGVRVYRTFPIFAKIAVPTSNLTAGTNTFYRFSVTANSSRDVGVYKFTVQMATTTATVSDLNVYAYTDSGFSVPVSGVRGDGAINLVNVASPAPTGSQDFVLQNGSGSTNPLQIPAGTTRYFEVRGTAAGVTNGTVQTSIQGDAGFPSLSGLMDSAANIDADTNDDFIWSPNATTTSVAGNNDWTNGFQVIGLSASAMDTSVLEDN